MKKPYHLFWIFTGIILENVCWNCTIATIPCTIAIAKIPTVDKFESKFSLQHSLNLVCSLNFSYLAAQNITEIYNLGCLLLWIKISKQEFGYPSVRNKRIPNFRGGVLNSAVHGTSAWVLVHPKGDRRRSSEVRKTRRKKAPSLSSLGAQRKCLRNTSSAAPRSRDWFFFPPTNPPPRVLTLGGLYLILFDVNDWVRESSDDVH
jgi:hypothetical protein